MSDADCEIVFWFADACNKLILKYNGGKFFVADCKMISEASLQNMYTSQGIFIYVGTLPYTFAGKYEDKIDSYFKKLYRDLLFDQTLCFFEELMSACSSAYYLPASKSGLYLALSAFGSIFAELSQNRSSISKSVSIPAISKPLSDYFLELTNINSKHAASNGYSTYVAEIEENILHGTVGFDYENKRLVFFPEGTQLSLDLSVTSSMVSEISPITAYLKFILPKQEEPSLSMRLTVLGLTKGKPLLLVEEPEAHIHPVNQIKLIKVLAKLVKDGKIKLIITSHSNYLFNQCSNLVMDGSIDKEKFRAVLLKATETGSEAVDLDVDKYGIEDKNFVDAAEAIYEEKLALFEKINATV